MNKMFGTAVLGTALAAGSSVAQGQQSPTGDIIGQTNARAQSVNIPVGSSIQIGVSSVDKKTVGSGSVIFGSDAFQFTLGADTDKHAIAAGGYGWSGGYFFAGSSIAKEKIAGQDRYGNTYNSDLKGASQFASFNITEGLPFDTRKAMFEYIQKRVGDKALVSTTEQYDVISVSVTHAQVVLDALERHTYNTTTTVVTHEVRTETTALGGKSKQGKIAIEFNIGKTGTLIFSIAKNSIKIPGKQDSSSKTGSVLYTKYSSADAMNYSIGANNNGRIVAGLEKQVGGSTSPWSVGVSAYKDTKGQKDAGVQGFLRYTWGRLNPGVRPESSVDQLNQALKGVHTNASYQIRGLENMVHVVSERTDTIIASESTTSTNVVDINKPKPPESGIDSPTTKVVEVNNITPNSASLLCNIVDLDGVTGACTVIDLDAGNAVLYSGNITPEPRALTLTPGHNYQVQLVGSSKKKNQDNTYILAPVSEIKNFKAGAEVWTPPTLPATLPAINVGDGAGGSVVFSVVMPSNMVDQNNNPIQFNLDGLPNIDAAGTPVSWTISQNGTTINISSTQFQGMPPATTIQTYPLVVTPVGNSANGSTSISLRIETN